MENKIKYIYEEDTHNLNDPGIIVPVIIDLLKPISVVDVGCGIGTFLNVFAKYGIYDYLGIDGTWVNKELLQKNIPLEYFKEVDLEKGFELNRKFDLAICLEVVEHLDQNVANNVIRNLTSLTDTILFSAAIPGQMGQNHLNEQWPEYWQQKFALHGYEMLDIIRPLFWEHTNLARWYKQNIFLIVKTGTKEHLKEIKHFSANKMLAFVHPEYYTLRVNEVIALSNANNNLNNELTTIKTGKVSYLFYIKLFIKKLLCTFKV